MLLCKFVDILLGGLPLPWFQDLLLRRHVQACPRCKSHLVSRKEAGFYLSSETDFPDDPGFNLAVKEKAERRLKIEDRGLPFRRPAVRWAFAAAAMLLLVTAAFLWFSRGTGEDIVSSGAGGSEKFRINHLIVEGVPAAPLIVHPRDSNMVIIWIERNFDSPDRNGEMGGRL